MARVHALVFALLLVAAVVLAEPAGVVIVSNTTETPVPQAAASITTAGGSFTTLVLNATTQTTRWKAYVGNVTGELTLSDANAQAIYDWDLAAITGEVYTSRNNSIDWSEIRCAASGTIASEEIALNHTGTADSINRTFNGTVHAGFYVGVRYLSPSTCRAVATYTNGTAQAPSEDADFQEILLDDTQSLVYATLLEDDVSGYNSDPFDFQMIVAEAQAETPSTYYFWAELG